MTDTLNTPTPGEQLPGTTSVNPVNVLPNQTTVTPTDDAAKLAAEAAAKEAADKLAAAKASEPTPVVYEPTGDPGLDLCMSFLGKLGFDLEHPAMAKAGEGDFTLLRAELALLGDKAKGFEQVLAVGEAAYKAKDAEYKARAEEDRKKIHEAAGGEATWAKVKEWAATNATADERTSINAALGAGGVTAQAMAAWLSNQWATANNVTVKGKPAASQNASSAAASTAPLTAEGFRLETNKLRAQFGNRFVETKEYADLQARRRAAL